MTISNRFGRRADLLAFAGLALLLAACGSTAPAQEPAPPPAEPPAQEVVVVVTATPLAEVPELAAQPVPTLALPEEVDEPAADADAAAEAPPEPAEAPAVEQPAVEVSSAPRDAVVSNESWTPQVERFDSLQYALVPAGCFNMGTNDASAAEKPVNEQCFDQPFWIGLTEVTNDQYGTDGSFYPDDFPRNYVTWFDAQRFCESFGARLPSEAEWEYASRGPNGYKYPFGDVFLPGFVIHIDNALGPEVVGSQREGASWIGAFDMSGNIREWTSSAYFDYPYTVRDGREDPTPSGDPHRVVRGGSYMSGRDTVRLTMREWYDWNYDAADIGFRCARDVS